jgi:3-deoxy-D-manno-octulosonate 8-phosphate phosphatase (KDO 8-P phosphatase)
VTGPGFPPGLAARAARLRLLLFDVDGVLTDGAVELHADGTEAKRFHIRDGTGIVLAHRAGLLTGLLSGRESAAAARRAAELGMPIVHLGVASKTDAYERILAAHGLTDDEVGFMGDDLLDLAVLARVGIAAAPADAVAEVRARADWVASAPGGHGAVREFIEAVLRSSGHWDRLVSPPPGAEARVAPVREPS